MVKVVVVGGTGFVASHVIKYLLEAGGFEVTTTLRSKDPAKLDFVRNMVPGKTVDIAHADMDDDVSVWTKVLEGAEYVIHCAAVLPPVEPKDGEISVVQVNVNGTTKILNAAKQHTSIKRVVLTSSVAAMSVGYPHFTFTKENPVNESHWTNLNGPGCISYPRSKTLAEQAAWKFIETEKPAFDLAVINPVLITGPLLANFQKSSSQVIEALMNGRMPAVPDLAFAVVDVRDVARAHVQAMLIPEAGGKRFVCSGDSNPYTFKQLSLWIQERYPEYKPPTRQLPNWLGRVLAFFDGGVRMFVDSLGDRQYLDNRLSRDVLKLEYLPIKESVWVMAQSLIDFGVLPKK